MTKKLVLALLAALTLGDVALPAFAADEPTVAASGTRVSLCARRKRKKRARHHRGKSAGKKKPAPVQL